jgi:uncharacterized NAD(P)/FAD-binding protein YdhS
MRDYDAERPPEPWQWLALDEVERVRLVREYHKRKRIDAISLQGHAAFHAIVETQVAMGEPSAVAATLRRLQSEGLDRHDAIHAIGSVLAEQFHAVASGSAQTDPNPAYAAALERLSAESWRHAR